MRGHADCHGGELLDCEELDKRVQFSTAFIGIAFHPDLYLLLFPNTDCRTSF